MTRNGRVIYWSRERLLEAIRAHYVEHGKPPTMADWSRATPTTPDCNTVAKSFGSWNQGIRAAGLTPRPSSFDHMLRRFLAVMPEESTIDREAHAESIALAVEQARARAAA